MIRRLTATVLVTVAIAVLTIFFVGEALTHPVLHPVGPPPDALRAAEAVILHTTANQPVAGWWLEGVPGSGAVLLLHGVRSDRRSMTGRAALLSHLGYSVLLIDLPGHGESPAPHITFGLNESNAVRAALAFVATTAPNQRVGVIGVSLGAASTVLASPDPAPAAVILESMYPTIEEAVSDRLSLHLGSWAASLTPMLLWQLPLRLGIWPKDLHPIDLLPRMNAPILIAAGSVDRHTTLAETRRLFAVAREPKELWIVEGAAHVDLQAFDPAGYDAHVVAFLDRYLRAGTQAPADRTDPSIAATPSTRP